MNAPPDPSAATDGRRYGKRTLSERRAERRARLLDAALDLFGTAGYTSTSVEQICSTASVSTRNFYEEFANREAVLIELHDLVNERAFHAVVAATESNPIDTADRAVLANRIEAGVRAYFSTMTADPRFARIAIAETMGVGPDVDAARRGSLDLFTSFLAAELTRIAEIGLAESRDFTLTAVAIVGAMNELVNTWPTSGGTARHLDRLVDEGTRLILSLVDAWERPGT